MLKLQRPTKGTVEALKTYIRGTHIDEDDKEVTSDVEDQEIEDEGAEDKGIEDEGAEDAGIEEKLRPRQFAVQSAADTMLEGDEDFVSLHPPGDDDLGTTLAAWCFGWLLKVSHVTLFFKSGNAKRK
jgi:hypothetical protein